MRMILTETHGIPPLFWAQVDNYATRMFKLLLPVLIWVGRTWTENAESPVHMIFQMLHSDFAYAAWLAVNVRLSPTVFHFEWHQPGDRYLPEQIELYPEVYTESRFSSLKYGFDGILTRGVRSSRSRRSGPARTARVMVSVVPLVQRLRLIDDDDDKGACGFQRVTLLDPRVVYYHGLDNEEDDVAQFSTTLLNYSSRVKLRRQPDIKFMTNLMVWAIMIIFSYPVLAYFCRIPMEVYETRAGVRA